MNLDDAVELWAENAAGMADDGPSLPYPSMVAMTLAGSAPSPYHRLNVGVLTMLAASEYGLEEVPLDMAAARCRAIDSQFYDEYAQAHGRRPKGAAVMEASWVATDRALYYIAPGIAGMRRWPWVRTRIEPGKTGRRSAKFVVVDEQGKWKFSTGSRALPSLLACANWASAR